MNGWLIALGLFAAYVTFVVWLIQSGRLKKWNLSLMLGIVLMVRTQRGKGLLDALARPKRFWNAFGEFGTVLCLVGMTLMSVLFLWSVYFALQPDSGVEPLGASEILVIPGVNPFVPLWYGILALILTLVVHEGGHGVLARANNMRVKSLGLLFAIVPIGAFVEPDEDDLRQSTRRRRLRVFAAGPLLNLTFAAIFLGLFVAGVGASQPHEGVGVYGLREDGPAALAGIGNGDRILALDGVPTLTPEAFAEQMETKSPGDDAQVRIQGGRTLDVVLGSRWDGFTQETRERIFTNEDGFGVAVCQASGIEASSGPDCATKLQERAALGVNVHDAQVTRSVLAHPFSRDCEGSGGRRVFCEMSGFLTLVSLPVGEVRGQPVLSYLLPTFHDEPFGGPLYWPAVTLCFWMFWINLMVGLTNILPMLPLDGGHIFRDAVGGVVNKVAPRADEQKRDRFVNRAATTVSFVILGAFLLQIVGPRLVQ